MNTFAKTLIIGLSLSVSFIGLGQPRTNVSSKVDPFWGSTEGNIFPGASVPFGLVKLGPNIINGWTPASGYRFDEPVIGFSHNQTSGTGGSPRYGNILIIPQVDSIITNRIKKFPKTNEYAQPGYYNATLGEKNTAVRAELTASKNVGFHTYKFIKKYAQTDSLNANFVIDISNTTHRIRNGEASTYCKSGDFQIVSPTTLEGSAQFAGGWGGDNPYTIYFVVEFDQPYSTCGIWQNELQKPNVKQFSITNTDRKPNRFGAFFSFKKKINEQVDVKVAISYLSLEKARANLLEQKDNNFETAQQNATFLWENALSKINVSGGSIAAQKLFYSALRNTMLMPTDVTGNTQGWDGNTPHFWDFYCVWDVFRATMPLYTLIYPDKQRQMIQCLLEIYKTKGYMPDAWIAGDFAQIQGGSNADVVLADAVVKKLGGFDLRTALSASLKSAEIESDKPNLKGRYVNDYKKYGYVLPETTAGSVSRTLEYAYNDFCISQIAKAASETATEINYKKQSDKVFNLFYPEYKMFWGKDSVGQWKPDFSPVSLRKDHWNDPYFYEGGSQIYSTYLPHDMAKLIQLHGGNEAYQKYLDELFDSGRFSIENEPEFLIPYQYIYAGDYASTAKRVHEILTTKYLPGANGLPGQDDSGSMSAWYVFSSMGFFPVAGQDLYLIGTPLFSQSVIQLEGNKKLIITAKNVSPKNIYVTKATLNGKTLKHAWFTHTQISKGGKLVLTMSDKPTSWGNNTPPPSISTENSK